MLAVLDFGEALRALKDGRWVRRKGWNGRGMHLYLEDGLYRSMPRASGRKVVYSDGGKYDPCIVMFTALGTHQPGWTASQADMLAADWEIVPYEEMR